MADKRSRVPESLVQQCQFYVLMNLEEFPVDYLSLLPLYTRKDLLWQLPLADVCHLEDTKFTEGLDMAAYWKYPFDEQGFDLKCWCDRDITCKSCFQEWDVTAYERELLYGLLLTFAFGSEYLLDGDFYFRSPHAKDGEMDAISLLYAIRKPTMCGTCTLKLPSRYSTHVNNRHEKKVNVNDVLTCFSKNKGELPKIISDISIFRNPNQGYAHFLRDVVFLNINGLPSDKQGLKFLKAVISEATNLEMLILDQWGEDDDWQSLDDLCDLLSSQPTFLSKFRQLTIHSSISLLGFVVTQKNFNRLITAYFSAPTDHTQKLEFTHTKIKCYEISDDHAPTIDQSYLHFKTIELDNDCQFVSEYVAKPATISHWLGQGVCELKKADERSSWLFKVDREETCTVTRKRKRYSDAIMQTDTL